MAQVGTHDLEIRLDIQCDDCGLTLNVSTTVNYAGLNCLRISPCTTCMEKARQEGLEQGREEKED
jgi:hypothetical protein